jgi:chemotaxis methyl-accepting protein methylase
MTYREFLRNTLPHLGLRWRRFRGKSIRRRIITRLQWLGFRSFTSYNTYLLDNAEEQKELASLLTVTITRFWRNSLLFEALAHTWLPAVIAKLDPGEPLRIWSAGCASGEEPYSLVILWQQVFAGSGRELIILASDTDNRCLKRALRGSYPASSFREMPMSLRKKYCTNRNGIFSLPEDFPKRISWVEHNLISDPPFPGNHLIFCRNLVYTYFIEPIQQEITLRFHQVVKPGGLLVVGRKDHLPAGTEDLFRCVDHPIYQRVDTPEDNKE